MRGRDSRAGATVTVCGRRERPRVALRCDASLRIGTGHVMRCLTLADALRAQGAECLFLCRPHEGHLISLIGARGYPVTTLSAPGASGRRALSDAAPPLPAHAEWLGRSWVEDAAETATALGPQGTDWLIVDHYALNRSWEQALRPQVRRLMVIDDLADRAHDCDLLLDQNLGRRAADYAPHVPAAARLFIGPTHALLRPEFARARNISLARRTQPALRHLLITLGGVDQDNVTGQILSVLADCALPDLQSIEVILGAAAPWIAVVRQIAAQMPWPTTIRVGITDMAETMSRSDLAIGATGGTSWERCCLGLPTIQMVLAENQIEAAQALEVAGAALTVDAGNLSDTLPKVLGALDPTRLTALSRQAARITDGSGAQRITREIVELS
ncbi:UDP-2,4-diacetamido-2,4,6-trideoxy-beta-L-altropyranose hydrolase [uncultured Paracoccus sp.]|uniref:UDP-2,4-diacetamido-2,4, 6-trideoxy-beta-L-altropyranose hydrolase n=1 Tax=uncultured Paracoccus sp. TaxID=189685 RepID=UPI00260AE10F|nr:UDP-2,4-diacetamido-2,4,6-trideoxy-beta-L-altropyranose hydrolase [uncultured Paracoccus sp.]